MVAAGAASHSDHGRDLVETLLAVGEGKAPGFGITDQAKLDRLAAEFGVAGDLPPLAKAKELALAMMEEYGIKKGYLTFTRRLPAARLEKWRNLGIEPRGVDWEVTEMMHRTHMGVDNDPVNLLVQALRCALADGWGGSMIATEISDVLFGTPKPTASQVNLAVLQGDQVNLILHGHSPLVSEMVARAAQDPKLVARAQALGAKGINLAGLCCTGNEVLMRRGIPMAGNHLVQELALITGAVEAMVVDYQCIMPSLGDLAACYHTKFYTTSPKAKFNGATHLPFTPENGEALGRELVAQAVENFARRRPERVLIPGAPVSQVSGFSVEVIEQALGGTWEPLLNAIKAGQIRGAVGVVGCNNPKVVQDYGHTTLTRKLIENDILVVDTGCAAVAHAKAGFKRPEAAELAGPGLKAVCRALGIPPVLHMGSCVDNTRIVNLATVLANALGVDLDQLPLAAAAPEWYSEKAATIACYAVASGIYTVLGVMPPDPGERHGHRPFAQRPGGAPGRHLRGGAGPRQGRGPDHQPRGRQAPGLGPGGPRKLSGAPGAPPSIQKAFGEKPVANQIEKLGPKDFFTGCLVIMVAIFVVPLLVLLFKVSVYLAIVIGVIVAIILGIALLGKIVRLIFFSREAG